MDELQQAVVHELRYQESMWQGDYESAFDSARDVLGAITHSDLRGYRALWHYLAGSAALLAAQNGASEFDRQARIHFASAKDAAKGIPWLVALSRYDSATEEQERQNALVMRQVERLETSLVALGNLHNRSFAKREKEILEGLSDPGKFESAQLLLGEFLGFAVGKIEDDASPDPWWTADEICFVFEDHVATTTPEPVINPTKARQAASHIEWIKTNVPEASQSKILAVLVTEATKTTKGAIPSLKKVSLWPADEFRKWAKNSIGIVRQLRKTFTQPGDLDWRIKAAEALEQNGIDAVSLYMELSRRLAADHLVVDGS